MSPTQYFGMGAFVGMVCAWFLFQITLFRMEERYKKKFNETFNHMDERLRQMHLNHMEDYIRLKEALGIRKDGPPPPLQ